MRHPLFRIHEGGELATASVRLPEILPVEDVAEQLERVSQIIGGLGCNFITDEETESAVVRFVNYPRAKYGDRTQERIDWTARHVARSLGGSTVGRASPKRFYQMNNRAVVGLRYGYEGEGMADPDDFLGAIKSKRVPQIGSKLMHVLSVSPGNIYAEPALALSFKNRSAIIEIARAATTFGQERFSLEVPMYGRVFMIETPLCTDPDSTPYIRKTATGIPQHVFAPRQHST